MHTTGLLLGGVKDERQCLGIVNLHLHDDVVPLTARNFRILAEGRGGFGYEGSKVHRVVPHFIIQGGAYEVGDGTLGRAADSSVLQRRFPF